jgi:hypothetical protein
MTAVEVVMAVTVSGALHASAAPIACAHSDGYTSCNGAGRVDTTSAGRHHRKPGKGSGSSNSVGTIGYVACGPNAVEQLKARGDRSAAADARNNCTPALAGRCQNTKYVDGLTRVMAIRIRKEADGKWQYAGSTCMGLPPKVSVADVRARAVRLVPAAALGVAPKAATLVNIQTLLWVAAPKNRTLAPITILGHRVVITLELDHVDYTFGDGATDTQPDPGKPYDDANDPCNTKLCPDYYGHIYTVTGRKTITATASWNASFTVDGGGAVTIPGTVAGPTATLSMLVRQARAVLVPNPGER